MPGCRGSTSASSRNSPKNKSPMSNITLVEAINLALARAMEEDDSVVVLGEDVGINGGVFRATAGLRQRFGAERVADTPLAEGLIAGMAVGMAAEGLKPVAEIQFAGFAYTAIDQMLNHAGRLRHRTQGRLSCPMVLRTPCGAGIHAPEHRLRYPRRVSILAVACVWAASRRYPGPRPGGLPGTVAALSTVQRGSGRRRHAAPPG